MPNRPFPNGRPGAMMGCPARRPTRRPPERAAPAMAHPDDALALPYAAPAPPALPALAVGFSSLPPPPEEPSLVWRVVVRYFKLLLVAGVVSGLVAAAAGW